MGPGASKVCCNTIVGALSMAGTNSDCNLATGRYTLDLEMHVAQLLRSNDIHPIATKNTDPNKVKADYLESCLCY